MVAELRFRAMGSDALVVCVGGDELELAARARSRIDDLERRWSRFRPDSEVNLINAAGGRPVPVSTVTVDLATAAVDAWGWTGGRFDPTLRIALEQLGYDRSFEQVVSEPGADRPEHGVPGGGRTRTDGLGLTVDQMAGTVAVDPSRGLDLGGIGKGWAADLVVDDLLHAGADGACVDIGGDVRVAGRAPAAGGWVVGVADPACDNEVAAIAVVLDDGAVATSTRRRRRWIVGGRVAHHLIDPATGLPADRDLDTVTVIGAEAGWAEVVAKAALIAGGAEGSELIESSGLSGLLRRADGAVVRVGDFSSFEVPVPGGLEGAEPAVGGRRG